MVGDDLLVTNPTRVQTAIEKKACNALLLKVHRHTLQGRDTDCCKPILNSMRTVERGHMSHASSCTNAFYKTVL